MNTDLYQALTVALLGAITVLLIVVIAVLGRLRKALDSNKAAIFHDLPAQPSVTEHTEASGPAPAQEAPPGAAPSEAQERPVDGEQEQARDPVGARSVFTRPEERAEAAGAESAAADASAGMQQADTQQVEVGRHEASPEQEEPREQAFEEPQEQPFERDGRWWFRRGEELLVYDEQTGQWLQVAGPPGGLGRSRSSGEASGAVATETRTVTETAAAGAQEEGASSTRSFWKCSSCGAINGAAASSCRMCFAARP
jgi:hypothetical protein